MEHRHHSQAHGRNLYLRSLLDHLGWTPEKLARRINAVLQELPGQKRSISIKTPYGWLRGEIPHAPLPDVTAFVLTCELHAPVDFQRLWPGARKNEAWRPEAATSGLPWDQSGLLQFLGEWTAEMLTRRRFSVISGAALTTPVWGLLEHPAPTLATVENSGGQVTGAVLSMIENTVVHAQQLDDHQGGGAALDYVADQYAAVSRLARRSSYSPAAGRRLYAALAQLAQTAGFMAYDGAGDDGRAQRWYDAGLRAAHTAGDRSLIASILSLMSNQAATGGQVSDALQLASAAELAAGQSAASVRALISARSCLAYAAAGDLSGLRRAREDSRTHLSIQHTDPPPHWVGYADSTELDAIAGRSLAILARRVPHRTAPLLAEAETLLRDRAYTTDPRHQRSAMRHSAWLATTHTHAGELDQAVTAGRSALKSMGLVTSARSIGLLYQLRDELADHAHRAPRVRRFVGELDHALTGSSAPASPA